MKKLSDRKPQDYLNNGFRRLIENRKRLQRQFSSNLQSWSERFSIRARKTGLIVFMVLSSGYCAWLIVHGTTGPDHLRFGDIRRVEIPKTLGKVRQGDSTGHNGYPTDVNTQSRKQHKEADHGKGKK